MLLGASLRCFWQGLECYSDTEKDKGQCWYNYDECEAIDVKNIFLPLSLSFQVSWNLLSQFQWYIATFFDPNSNIQCKTYNG